MSLQQEMARLPAAATATSCHLLSAAVLRHSSSHCSPPCPQDEAGARAGEGLGTQALCFHGGGENLGLPKPDLPCHHRVGVLPSGKQVALVPCPGSPVWAAVLQAAPRVTLLGALQESAWIQGLGVLLPELKILST